MFKNEVAAMISNVLNMPQENILPLILENEDLKRGDYSIACFSFAKQLKLSPDNIAKKISDNVKLSNNFVSVSSIGGYVNFFVNKAVYINRIVSKVDSEKGKYGSSKQGVKKKCLIEHTSINPNASPHIGRARNAIIGDFVARLMKFEGYEVQVHYFVNDIGKQIAMLVLGAEKCDKVKFDQLLSLYVSINQQVNEDPAIASKVFELLNKLEHGDAEVRERFRSIVDVCIDGQTKILTDLGIHYDYFDYESEFLFNNSLDLIIKRLKEQGMLFEDENGRYVINLEMHNLAPLVVTRQDKTSLYPLRDIAYTIWKANQNPDRNIIILGEDQKLYFNQIRATVEELGHTAPEAIHYSFVTLADGKMSTRNGAVVLLADFMNEAMLKVNQEMERRYGSVDDERVKAIAYGAVKYTMEKASNDKSVVFDWDKALCFEGKSGPYIHYCYARIQSLLRRCPELDLKNASYEECGIHEYMVAKLIAEFPNIVGRATIIMSPHLIANYLYELAKAFSSFYQKCSILNLPNDELRVARIKLVLAVKQVIENSFYLLGIETIDRM